MALLEVEQLSVGFGGLVAVDNVGLSIESGEIRGLIGPNGAGKTTFFNTISGLVIPTDGKIRFAGNDITALPAHERAACGIRRTFQTMQLVQNLTVHENILIGLHAELPNNTLQTLFGFAGSRSADGDAEERITEVLHYLAIENLMRREVKSLTFAEQRYVEIARALVARPKLIMLDEPAAGLTPVADREARCTSGPAARRLGRYDSPHRTCRISGLKRLQPNCGPRPGSGNRRGDRP